jgi:puromycin-sensitive aminopeptidase
VCSPPSVSLLPTLYQPERYHIDLKVDTVQSEFSGVVRISLLPGAASIVERGQANQSFAGQLTHIECDANALVLHAKELVLSDVSVVGADGQRHGAIGVRALSSEAVCLVFDAALVDFRAWSAAGHAIELTCAFAGALRDQLVGLYRCTFVDDSGATRVMASTQFEPVHARRMFPCFDEPAIRAVFELRVTARSAVVSCMPLVSFHTLAADPSDESSRGFFVSTFEPTPKLPTYLLAVVCADLHAIESQTASGCKVRVLATTATKASAGRRMLNYAVRCIPIYEKLFGMPFPLRKLDLIAVPDFGMGAMENWGAITARETRLLVTATTSSSTLVSSLRTLCHEISHTWFGNIVTPLWWCDLWLKEGFARFCEFVAAAQLEPTFQLWELFDSDVFGLALGLDSMAATHPIEVPVVDVEAIGQIFDAISYAKGACVIRMMAHHVGVDVFERGMAKYVSKFQYGNATSAELFTVVGEEAGEALSPIFRPWTLHSGFPVISVSADYDVRGSISSVTLSQRRFAVRRGEAGDSDAGADAETLWSVPIIMARGEQYLRHGALFKSSVPSEFLTRFIMPANREYSLGLAAVDDDGDVPDSKWLVVNVGQIGFYRVMYDAPLLSSLVDAIIDGKLATTERLALHSNTFALAIGGILPLEQLVEVMATLRMEREWSVWSAAATGIEDLLNCFACGAQREAAATLVKKIVGDAFEALCGSAVVQERPPSPSAGDSGADDDATPPEPVVVSERDQRRQRYVPVRGMLTHILSSVDHDAVVDFALAEFARGVANVPVQRAYMVLKLAVRRLGAPAWHALNEARTHGSTQEEQVRLLTAMSHVREPELFRRNLELLFEVRQQQATPLLASMWVGEDECGAIAWQWFTANAARIAKHFSVQVLDSVVHAFVQFFVTTPERALECEAFFAATPMPSVSSSIERGLETARNRIAFAARSGARLQSLVELLL